MKRQSLDPEIEALVDRPLSAEEVTRILAASVTDAEVEATLELVRWFMRRYPTANERFAYNRRAYARAIARPQLAPPRGREAPDQKKSIV